MIKEIIKNLVDKYDTKEPFDLCDYLNIKVIFSDLGNRIMGFYQKTESIMIIHINSNLNYHMKRCVCAHELGHAIARPDMNISFFIKNSLLNKDKYEIEADTFAAELLLDDVFPIEYMEYTVEQIAAAENVPVSFIELKCKHLHDN